MRNYVIYVHGAGARVPLSYLRNVTMYDRALPEMEIGLWVVENMNPPTHPRRLGVLFSATLG